MHADRHWGPCPLNAPKIITHLFKLGGHVRILFFDFSSAFNTIQPPLFMDKLGCIGVDSTLVTSIMGYLRGWPLESCASQMLLLRIGASQWTVLVPFLVIYTSNLKYISLSCHMHKYLDGRAVLAGVRNGQDRCLTGVFYEWVERYGLLLNTSKTTDIVVLLVFRSLISACEHSGVAIVSHIGTWVVIWKKN